MQPGRKEARKEEKKEGGKGGREGTTGSNIQWIYTYRSITWVAFSISWNIVLLPQ